MAANGNSSSGSNGSVTHVVSSHDAKELEAILRRIREEKSTGSLIINFSQGAPAGKLEWKERASSSSPYVGRE